MPTHAPGGAEAAEAAPEAGAAVPPAQAEAGAAGQAPAEAAGQPAQSPASAQPQPAEFTPPQLTQPAAPPQPRPAEFASPQPAQPAPPRPQYGEYASPQSGHAAPPQPAYGEYAPTHPGQPAPSQPAYGEYAPTHPGQPAPSQPAYGEYAPTHSGPTPPQYTAPAYGAPQYAPAPTAWPAQEPAPRSRALGLTSMLIALPLFVLSVIASAIVGVTIGPFATRSATGFSYNTGDLPASEAASIAPVGLLMGAQLLVGTALGIFALVLGIVAVATKRGRPFGIVGIIVSVAAPIVSFAVYAITLAASLPPA
ncbi:hypothetical protein DOE76_03770 [Leifsonia sp. ku-ls]|nr:hypothetical protein DOE76_03770 [Leifsonia sp. ku-ls]